ncbi:MAG: hypothetical protein ACRERC_17055 [Candidatus Binatia bacterium]
MFVREKYDRHGHQRHQLVRSVRRQGAVRQQLVAYLGEATSVDAALHQWPPQIAILRQQSAELRSEAERLRAQMPPAWLETGVVPRPRRWGMRRAQQQFGRYWACWDRAAQLDRSADRLQRRFDRLRNVVEHGVGTTPDDEALDRGA